MTQATESIKYTPLYDFHKQLGAKMVEFAGYSMPVQYPLGIKQEHLHTREKAGLFDVSHMGQILLKGESAAAELEKLVPVDIVDLPKMKQRYALFTNSRGGVLDDLMVTNIEDGLFLVVNSACKQKDVEHLKRHIQHRCDIEMLKDRSLLALQGPAAAGIMAKLAPESSQMVFMTAANLVLDGVECLVTRSGYTGEDGFEISLPSSHAEHLARLLLEEEDVEMIGLGARDTLRLEAGLCLYGHDLNENITPVEAGLTWALSKERRKDGKRPGGYLGFDKIFEQLEKGIQMKRVGLQPEGKIPVRENSIIVDDDDQIIGKVSSGGFGPSVGGPVSMGYVPIESAKEGTKLWALVRDRAIPMQVVPLPFMKTHYYRG